MLERACTKRVILTSAITHTLKSCIQNTIRNHPYIITTSSIVIQIKQKASIAIFYPAILEISLSRYCSVKRVTKHSLTLRDISMKISAKVIETITGWIDNNIHRRLRIEDVARYSGYSKWHFQRIFLYYKGESIGRYIRIRKLQLAAQDLKNTQERIVDISVKYGFDSQQSFNRLFTRSFKMSPGTYRKVKGVRG